MVKTSPTSNIFFFPILAYEYCYTFYLSTISPQDIEPMIAPRAHIPVINEVLLSKINLCKRTYFLYQHPIQM